MMNAFSIITIVWVLSEIFLNFSLRSKGTDNQHVDKNSLRLIWLVIFISIFFANLVAGYVHCPISSNPTLPYVGLAMIVIGVVLRFFAINSLGNFFTVDVTIKQNHQLKTDGLYHYLRHPSYFASFISFVGYGLSLNNWLSFFIVTVSIFFVFSYRIRVEEKALIDYFGDKYINYKKQTKGLIPFVY